MAGQKERDSLRESLWESATESPIIAPVHLSGCQAIADCFMVNRATVRQWKTAGAPIAMIGGRLTAEYNMLMLWHIRQSATGTGQARMRPTNVQRYPYGKQ